MGANRNFRGIVRSLDPNLVTLYGQFTGAGAAAVTSVRCLGFSFARTGVGLFTATFDDCYPASEDGTPPLFEIRSSIVAAAATSGQLEGIVDSTAVAATKTLTLRWAVAAAAADVAAGEVVKMAFVFRNTGAPRKGV